MSAHDLLFVQSQLQQWVESWGIETRAIRIVRDLVSAASPVFGYVELKNNRAISDIVHKLNGKKIEAIPFLSGKRRLKCFPRKCIEKLT